MQLPTRPQDLAALLLSLGLMILSVFSLLALLFFMFQYELPKKKSFRNLITPFNMSLATISISLIGVFVCLAISSAGIRDPLNDGMISVLLQLFIGNIEVSYVIYAYHRSNGVIKRTMPTTYWFIVRLLPFSPLFFYAQLIPEIVLAFTDYDENTIDMLEHVCPIIAGVAALVFDTIFIYAFTRHLGRTELQEPDFVVISRHGIVTCVLCYVSMAVYACLALIPALDEYDALLLVVCNGVLLMVFLVLFGMKITLHRLSESEEERSVEGLKHSIEQAGRALRAKTAISSGASTSRK